MNRWNVVGTLVGLLLAGIASGLALPSLAQEETESPGELVDSVVAVVGDRVITRSDMNEAMAYQATVLAARRNAGMPADEVDREFARIQTEVRDNLVDNTLILLEAEEEGMEVDDQVEKQVDRVRQAYADKPEQLAQFLRARGFSSLEDYQQKMKEEMLRQRVVMMRVRSRTEVSEEELETEFAKTYRVAPQGEKACPGAWVPVHALEQVWFPFTQGATIDSVLAAYTQAYRCYMAMSRGEFTPEEAAEKCSQEGSIAQFGQLGEVDETKSFEAAFQQALEQLVDSPSPIGLSEPVIGQDGIRILHRTSTRKECRSDPEEIQRIKLNLKARMEDQRFEKALKFWVKELRGKYRVELKSL